MSIKVSQEAFDKIPHGTKLKYYYSCRCAECRAAVADYMAINAMAGRAAVRWMKENKPGIYRRILRESELKRAGKLPIGGQIKKGSEVVHANPDFSVLGTGKITAKKDEKVRVAWSNGLAGWLAVDEVKISSQDQ